MTSTCWKPLHLNFSPRVPSLLIKYGFEQSQYKIFLTDLTYIWTEALDRRQIVKRALNVDTSIDPSESTDQFQILLRNIQKSLDGVEGTVLSMSRVEKSKQLNLHAVTQLPAPLNPLCWPIHLTLASPEVLTTELILPCLGQQFVAKAQIDSLLQQLKDKDHVIGKLADRMQYDGTDFSQVFPGAIRSKVGTKLGVRESAGKLVKGFGDFDEEHWRNTLSSFLGLSVNLSDMIPLIFAPGLNTLEVNISTDQADWLRQLKEEDYQEEKSSTGVVSRKAESSNHTATVQINMSFDGHFQRQTTPTRMSPTFLRRKKRSTGSDTESFQTQQEQRSDWDHNSTTANESDDDRDGDGQLQKPEGLPQDICIRESAVRRTGSQLSSEVPTLREADRFEIDAAISPSAIDGMNASLEVFFEKNEHFSLSESPKSIEALPKSKGKPGRIGGRIEPEKLGESNYKPIRGERNVLDDTSRAASVDTGGKEEEQVPSAVGSTMVGGVLNPPNASVIRRENAKERANSRREQLKRQLENRSNVAVKKRRKF